MTINEAGDKNPIRQEKESSVNSDPLKGYEWIDGEEILLRDGSKIVLIKNGKNNFGFSYIDENGTYHPSLSHDSGISNPDDKNSPFLLFGDTIMEVGEELPEKKEQNEAEETKENPPIEKIVSSEKKIKISPAVKKIATEKGLTEEDLQKITGTGKGDNITKKDIEEYLNNASNNSDEENFGEWKEFEPGKKLVVFEEGNISIKVGSEFYIDKIKYVVTSIKEREVNNDYIEYDISCDISGKNLDKNSTTTMDIGELEKSIEGIFESVDKNKDQLKKVLFTPPKSNIENKGEEKDEEINEIEIGGLTFKPGTTFNIYEDSDDDEDDGPTRLFLRVEKIKKPAGEKSRLKYIFTISEIERDENGEMIIESTKEKSGAWIKNKIKEFTKGKNLDWKKDGEKIKELASSINRFEKTKQKIENSRKNLKKDENLIENKNETQVEDANELADFFSKNLSSSFLKPKAVKEKRAEIKTEQKKIENKVEEKNREWAPGRATGVTETFSENKKDKSVNQKIEVVETFTKESEEPTSGLSLKEIIEKEKPKVVQIHSENLQKGKKEKKGNKWRNAWAWTLGLLGLGATAYGVKEYSEKDPNDKSLENESKYQYNTEKEPEGFYYKDKKDSSKQKVEKKETKTIFDEKIKDQDKKDQEIKSPTPTDSTKKIDKIKPVEKIQPKVDSSKVEIKDIQTPEAPKLLVDAVSIYHPELTIEEKNIVGNSYSKVLEYISGEEDIDSFYMNVSWLKTMSWSIDSTLDVSKKVLAGEYGEVEETEKRMAEYFIGFAKRQEEKGLPANGMNTEAYIISGLIRDAGIKKE